MGTCNGNAILFFFFFFSIQGLYLAGTATVGEGFSPSSQHLLVWQDSENKLVMESHMVLGWRC